MLTFIHDHIFIKCKGLYYTSGSLSPAILKRYTDLFGTMRLVTRCKENDLSSTAHQPSDSDKTTFVQVQNFLCLSGLKSYRTACKTIKQEVKDSQYLILRSGVFSAIAYRYAKRLKKPYLAEVVGCPWDAYWNHSFSGKLLAPVITLSTRRMVKHASHVLYVTNEFLQRRYPTNGKRAAISDVALNDIDETVLQRRLARIEKHSGPIILGTTAAVNVRYKGQQYVIEALAHLKKQGITNYTYQLVGGGDQSYLKALSKKFDVEDQVVFLGPLQHDKVFEWLDTIDLYVQPSRQEGLPRALVEAMSRALPAFGARTGGIPELLDAPFLFANSNRCIDAICKILTSFSQERLTDAAVRNFEKSKLYETRLLTDKREIFYKDYIAQVSST